MEITEVRIKLMDEVAGERLHAFCSITLDDCFVIRDLKIIEGHERSVRGHAQPQADLALPAMRLQEPPACAVLQSMRPAAEGRPRDQGRGRPGQAVCRYRPSDQFALPRDDPGQSHPLVPGRAAAVAAARLRVELRRFRRGLSRDRPPATWALARATAASRTRAKAGRPRQDRADQGRAGRSGPRAPHKTPRSSRPRGCRWRRTSAEASARESSSAPIKGRGTGRTSAKILHRVAEHAQAVSFGRSLAARPARVLRAIDVPLGMRHEAAHPARRVAYAGNAGRPIRWGFPGKALGRLVRTARRGVAQHDLAARFQRAQDLLVAHDELCPRHGPRANTWTWMPRKKTHGPLATRNRTQRSSNLPESFQASVAGGSSAVPSSSNRMPDAADLKAVADAQHQLVLLAKLVQPARPGDGGFGCRRSGPPPRRRHS